MPEVDDWPWPREKKGISLVASKLFAFRVQSLNWRVSACKHSHGHSSTYIGKKLKIHQRYSQVFNAFPGLPQTFVSETGLRFHKPFQSAALSSVSTSLSASVVESGVPSDSFSGCLHPRVVNYIGASSLGWDDSSSFTSSVFLGFTLIGVKSAFQLSVTEDPTFFHSLKFRGSSVQPLASLMVQV